MSRPGPRVRDWIARMAIKAGSAVGDIGKAVLVQTASAAIKSYYLGIR